MYNQVLRKNLSIFYVLLKDFHILDESAWTLIAGFTSYLSQLSYIPITPKAFCGLDNAILFAASMCSTLFILSMTFERFYSILKPHKAASFNTVKRAKVTIISIVIVSTLYNIPHVPITLKVGRQCVPYGNALQHILGQIYYWLSTVISFFLPFALLLIMNSFIIHIFKEKVRSKHYKVSRSRSNEGHASKIKNSEMQIFITLLFVTFAFLTLTTPAYALFLYVMVYDYEQSPSIFAGYYLFYNVGRSTYYTNYGINFFLYVISGKKFRSDLTGLFRCSNDKPTLTSLSDGQTKLSTITVHE